VATITINTNIAEVNDKLIAKLNKLKDKEYILRPVCFDLLELMKKRIHQDGKNAAGSAIGQYSNAYLKYRQKKHNRSADKKVIISLTRQVENDFSVIPTPTGYGLGFKNKFNLQKVTWLQNGRSAGSVAAHKRTVKTKEGTKTISVSGYQTKGWKGYGKIYQLTQEEQRYANDYISHLTQQALSDD
jgi:hypothetical protein